MFETDDGGIKAQYELLNILDGKSSALLTFNAIFLASISVWLGYVPLNYLHLALDIVFLLLLASCAILLSVIWIKWSSLGRSFAELDVIRWSRTKRYRIAWMLAAASIALVIVISAIHTIGTALTATGKCNEVCAWFYSEDVFGNLDVRRER